MSISYILTSGENLSIDPGEGFADAILVLLSRHGMRELRSSSTYDTEPVGLILDQPEFLNACVEIETAHQPAALLAACRRGPPALRPTCGERLAGSLAALGGGQEVRVAGPPLSLAPPDRA